MDVDKIAVLLEGLNKRDRKDVEQFIIDLHAKKQRPKDIVSLFKPNYTDRNGQTKKAAKWYGAIPGTRKSVALYADKQLSEGAAKMIGTLIGIRTSGQQMTPEVHEWIHKQPDRIVARLVSLDLIDPSTAAGGRGIEAHLAAYTAHLKHKGNTADYANICNARIASVIKGCGFRTLADVAAPKIEEFVSDELTAGRISQSTYNHYIRACKGFLRWLHKEDILIKDVAVRLSMIDVTDKKKNRRAMTIDEAAYLLDWAARHGKKRRSLSGWERSVLYRLAMRTGLRADEIRKLRVSSIKFQAKMVTVAPGYTKNKKGAVLPLTGDILKELRVLTQGKKSSDPLFRRITSETAKMLRADLKDARQKWLSEAKTPQERQAREESDFLKAQTDDGELDFHALRHSFATMLTASGVAPQDAKALLRHSSITLTVDRYSHLYKGAETAAVAKLPDFAATPETDAKTA